MITNNNEPRHNLVDDLTPTGEIQHLSSEILPPVFWDSIDLSLIEKTGVNAEVITSDFEREKSASSVVYIDSKPEYWPAIDVLRGWFRGRFGFETQVEQAWIKTYDETDNQLTMHQEWGRPSPGQYSVIVTMGGEGKFLYEDSKGSEEQIDCNQGTVVVLDGSVDPLHGSRENINRSIFVVVLSQDAYPEGH